MLVYVDYNAGSKAAAANATTVFTSADIPGSKVAAFHVELIGAGYDLTMVTGFRLKAGGQTILDMTIAQLRAYLQRIARGNTVLAANATRFTIPLNIPDGKGDERYLSQFPLNQSPQLEIQHGAGVPAGTSFLRVAWTAAEMPPAFYPLMLREAHGVPINSNRKRYDVRRGGKLRTFIFPTTGLTELRLILTGVVIFSVDLALLLEIQRMENSETETLTDPICVKLHEPMDAAIGSSYAEFTTDATWNAAGEVVIGALVPAV